jgi:outer membrane protein assembly factor BamB
MVVLCLAAGLAVLVPGSARPGARDAGPAAATVTVAPTVGAPGSRTAVAGAGFAPHELVDVSFDGTDLAVATTDGTGAFTGAAVSIPASALPGTHAIGAVGRTSQVSAQTTFLVRANWPGFRDDATLSGFNAVENVLSPATVGSLGIVWSAAAGGSIPAWNTPVVAMGMVFVAAPVSAMHRPPGRVSAFDEATGALRWSRNTSSPVGDSAPVVANNVVYVGASDGTLYAFGASHGRLLWTASTGAVYMVSSSPVVANGLVYYVGDGTLYAFDAVTGAVRWTASAGLIARSSPAVAGGRVYVGSQDKSLYAFDAATGALLWTAATKTPVDSTPAVANGLVYLGSGEGVLYAFDPATGALHWQRYLAGRLNGTAVASAPAVGGGVVALATQSGVLDVRGLALGHPLWSVAGEFFGISPALANGVVYATSLSGRLYAFDAASGAQLWVSGSDRLSSPPVVANGFVYAATSDGRIRAYSVPGP